MERICGSAPIPTRLLRPGSRKLMEIEPPKRACISNPGRGIGESQPSALVGRAGRSGFDSFHVHLRTGGRHGSPRNDFRTGSLLLIRPRRSPPRLHEGQRKKILDSLDLLRKDGYYLMIGATSRPFVARWPGVGYLSRKAHNSLRGGAHGARFRHPRTCARRPLRVTTNPFEVSRRTPVMLLGRPSFRSGAHPSYNIIGF